MTISRLRGPIAIAILSILAIALVGQTTRPPILHVAPMDWPVPVARSSSDETASRDVDARIVLARPLFTRGRRGGADAVASVDVMARPRLEGTILSANGFRRALLATDRGAIVLGEGDRVGSLVVRRIARGQVVADSGAGLVILTLAGMPYVGTRSAPRRPVPPMTKDPRLRTANNQDE